MSTEVPQLVFWLEPGRTPGELKREIKKRGGIEQIAAELLEELRKVEAKSSGFRKLAALRWRAYALLNLCREEGRLPPDGVMRLIFECLDLNDGKPHPDICERYKWPNPRETEGYDRVVEADARWIVATDQDQMTSYGLNKETGVPRTTIDVWRTEPEYERRRNRKVLELKLAQTQLPDDKRP